MFGTVIAYQVVTFLRLCGHDSPDETHEGRFRSSQDRVIMFDCRYFNLSMFISMMKALQSAEDLTTTGALMALGQS